MPPTPILFGGFPDYLEPQFSAATITGSADSDYPLSRLRERRLYRKARLTATGEWVIAWTYGGETREVSAFTLADHNFPADATVEPVLYGVDDFVVGVTEPVYTGGERPALEPWDTQFTSAETPDWGSFEWGGASPEERVLALPRNFIHPILESATASRNLPTKPRHITCMGGALIIRGLSTAPSAFAQAGMLMTTKLWQPPHTFRWNWKVEMQQLGELPQASRSGILWGRYWGAIRAMRLDLDLLDRSEILDFPWTFSYDRGWASPLLVIPEPDHPEFWWACAGLWSLKPGQLLGMEARPTLRQLWDIGTIQLVDWR